MNPPSVYDVTSPNSHMIRRITATVQSMSIFFSFDFFNPAYFGPEFLRISRFPIGALPRVYRFVDEFLRAIGRSLRPARDFLSLCDRFVNPVLRFFAQQRSCLFTRFWSPHHSNDRPHPEPNHESRADFRPILAYHSPSPSNPLNHE